MGAADTKRMHMYFQAHYVSVGAYLLQVGMNTTYTSGFP